MKDKCQEMVDQSFRKCRITVNPNGSEDSEINICGLENYRQTTEMLPDPSGKNIQDITAPSTQDLPLTSADNCGADSHELIDSLELEEDDGEDWDREDDEGATEKGTQDMAHSDEEGDTIIVRARR